MAGEQQRDVPAEVLLDQREGEIDPGGHSGRGGDVPVPYEDRLRSHLGVREAAREGVAVRPMGGGSTPGQQAGLGQQKRAGADGHDPLRPGRQFPDPADHRRVGRGGPRSAGHHQRVRGLGAGQVGVRQQAQPARRPHRPAAGPGCTDLVGVRPPGGLTGLGEDLQGPGDVQALYPVVEHDEHAAVSHASERGSGPSWRQRRVSHLSCHAHQHRAARRTGRDSHPCGGAARSAANGRTLPSGAAGDKRSPLAARDCGRPGQNLLLSASRGPGPRG